MSFTFDSVITLKGFTIGSKQTALILVGIVFASLGFGMHFILPGTGRSAFQTNITPMDTKTQSFSLTSDPVGLDFRLDFLGPNHPNLSIYFLDGPTYSMYIYGTPLSNLSAPITLDENGRGGIALSLVEGEVDYFLVLVNNGTSVISFTYYYSLLPSTFRSTVTIGFLGLFLIIIGFGWYYTGWKRYFLIGVSFNLVFFLVRIFTLAEYSLELPNVFIDYIHVELYNDYQYFYLSWIPNLWEGAWAYSTSLPVYLYPPLWIYTVGLFGSTPPWLPGVVLFTFNMLTGILVYKIAEVISGNEKKSLAAMMIYLLNPITIGYGSFMWLNPTPFVFFVMLSFYLALKNKAELSMVTLGIATLYKQFAVIFLPIIVLMFIKQKTDTTRKTSTIQFLRYTFIYTLIVGAVSLPFLIVSPNEFLSQMFSSSQAGFQYLANFIPDLWMTVHFNTFFLWLLGRSLFTDIIAWLIYNFVLLALSGLIVYGAFATYQQYQNDESSMDKKDLFMNAILWSFIALLCVQTFIPRGAYKFYLLAIMPFASLLFDYDDLTLTQPDEFVFEKRHLFIPLIITVVFLCYRFVYLWLIVALAWFYLIQSGEL
jgi:hypothetical protein